MDVSVNCIEFLQVWQAGATVKEATGPREIVTVWLAELLPDAFVAVSLAVYVPALA